MKKVYYEKVGRRYKPVSEYDSDLQYALPKGTHIIMVYPGGQSTRYSIDPALAPMIAAGRFAEDIIADKIVEASSMRPSKVPVTKEQRQAWQEVQRVFGDELYTLYIPSARDITQAGVVAMQQEADRLLKNTAVRSAYEQFMLVCELSKES